jgi:hypothetical protein
MSDSNKQRNNFSTVNVMKAAECQHSNDFTPKWQSDAQSAKKTVQVSAAQRLALAATNVMPHN